MKEALEAVSKLSATPVSEIVRNTIEMSIYQTYEFYTKFMEKYPDQLKLDNYSKELELVKKYTNSLEGKKLLPIRVDMIDWMEE